MNHNLETHPRLYKMARPGADYKHSLELLRRYKQMMPHVPTKSGIMVGLGETDDEVREIMDDMRAHDIEMITIGQYLQPSDGHLPVLRYVTPDMSSSSSAKPTAKASPTPPVARWCVQATTPTSRPPKPCAKATAAAAIIRNTAVFAPPARRRN